MNYSMTRVSANRKVGPIPVTYSSAETCPDACPLKGAGCYAESGHVHIHWKQVTAGKRGGSWDDLLHAVRSLPKGQLWRHNVAGDLPGTGDTLDPFELIRLAVANRGRRGFTYTHKPLRNALERSAVQQANADGFTVNLSANTLQHADELKALGVGPVVVVLPEDAPDTLTTPGGHHVVACPAEKNDSVSCSTCGACAVTTRKSIIGFHAHGSRKKKVNIIARFTQ